MLTWLLSTIVFSSKQLQLVVVRPPGDLFVSKVITHGLPMMAIGERKKETRTQNDRGECEAIHVDPY